MQQGFTYLNTIPYDIRYATSNNFIGRPINGYLKNICIVSDAVNIALQKAQEITLEMGLSLFVFEGYRPLKALEDMVFWSQTEDTLMKNRFYPSLSKEDLFSQQYIAIRSTHSRGAAVDVTLIEKNHTELDMGTEFDFFGEEAHTHNPTISADAKKNRQLLLSIMEKAGFENYTKEWWHFTLKNEPFPNQYFDFDVI